MNRIDWAVVIIVAIILVLTGMVIVGLLNPNNEFRDADGRLVLHGKVDGRFLDYLLHGPPVPRETTLVHVDSGRGTMRVTLETVPILSSVRLTVNLTIDWGRAPTIPEVLGVLFEPIRASVLFVFDAISWNASAANRFLVSPLGCTLAGMNLNSTACWSTTSGGAGGASVPTAGDNIICDGASGTASNIWSQTASIDVTTGTINTTGFLGTWNVSTFQWRNTGTVTHAGGTDLTVSGGDIIWGPTTMTAPITHSGVGTGGTLVFASLTINASTLTMAIAALTVNGNLTMGGGDLTATSGNGIVTGNVSIVATSAIAFGSGTWRLDGSWTNASTDSAVWDAGTGTVTFDSASNQTMTFDGSLLGENEFNNVVMNSTSASSVTFTMATRGIRWGGTLTVTDASGGTFLDETTLNPAFTGGNVTLSGTSPSGILSISATSNVASVLISTGTAYILFGAGTWQVSGSWSNSSTSASWSAGTSDVNFVSTSDVTVTFGGSALPVSEFYNLRFDPPGAPAETFTMAVRGVLWSHNLIVNHAIGPSRTTLDTGGFPLTGGLIAITSNASLSAGASTVSISNLSVSSACTLTITSGLWTVSGTWNTNATGNPNAVFTSGTGTVMMTGTAKTVALLDTTTNIFNNLTVTGTVIQTTSIGAKATISITSGSLTKTGKNTVFNHLAIAGGSVIDGSFTVSLFDVSSTLSNMTTISSFTAWATNASYEWTNTHSVALSTVTFVIGGNTPGFNFRVLKNSIFFSTGNVNFSGNVVFTMLGNDPLVTVLISAPGHGSLVKATAEPAGANCTYAGQRIDIGLDNGDGGGIPDDGILQPGEIDQTVYVCNGSNTLFLDVVEPPGINCTYGGEKITGGLDNGDGLGTAHDGILQPGEVDFTSYICNGTPGANGTNGTNGVSPGSNAVWVFFDLFITAGAFLVADIFGLFGLSDLTQERKRRK